jgi:two-component system chemotaxis sensor kinase CheA
VDRFLFDDSFVTQQVENFKEEFEENILLSEESLLELEKNPASEELFRNLMRSFHSIKGGSRVLLSLLQEAELKEVVKRIEEVSHLLEEVVQQAEAEEAEPGQGFFDFLYRGIDILRSLREGLFGGPREGIDRLVEDLRREASALRGRETTHLPVQENTQSVAAGNRALRDFGVQFLELFRYCLRSENPNWKLLEQNALFLERGCEGEGLQGLKTLLGEVRTACREGNREGLERIYQKLCQEFEGASVSSEGEALQPERRERPAAFQDFHKIRVDQEKIDTLVNLSGELLTLRNRYGYLLRKAEGHPLIREFKALFTEFSHILTSLQNVVLSMRMVPLGVLFDRYRRMVRDVARELGKEAELIIEGRDTSVDRNVAQMLVDPLTHLVRNAIDHGIETPEERKKAGKPPVGKVVLRAFQQGGSVVVRVEDDGRGLDPDRIRAKAVEKGFASPEEVLRLSDEEVVNFVFLPGFSTADRVSEISGRGIGMDVVKANIESIRGEVKLASQVGKGTTVELKIPLSLSVVSGLGIQVGEGEFILPLESVEALLKVPYGDIHSHRGAAFVRVRGDIIPLLFLGDLLLPGASRGTPGDTMVPLVLLRVSRGKCALAVDGYTGEGEFLVKPLPKCASARGLFSGATIRGDGKTILILNPERLVELLED